MTTLTLRCCGEKGHHSGEAYPLPAPFWFRLKGSEQRTQLWQRWLTGVNEVMQIRFTEAAVWQLTRMVVCAHLRSRAFLCHQGQLPLHSSPGLAADCDSTTRPLSVPETLSPPLTLARSPGSTAPVLP